MTAKSPQSSLLEPYQGVRAQLSGAAEPASFKRFIVRADMARDRRAWVAAYFRYRAALDLCPGAAGYHVQLGHCLKEAGFVEAAVCAYRSALLLGAPIGDVAEHLLFAAERSGEPETLERIEALCAGVTRGDPDIMGLPLLDDLRIMAATLGLADRIGAFAFSGWMRRGLTLAQVRLEMEALQSAPVRSHGWMTLADASRVAFEGFPQRSRLTLGRACDAVLSAVRARRARVIRAITAWASPPMPLRSIAVEVAAWAGAMETAGHRAPETFLALARDGLEAVNSAGVTRLIRRPDIRRMANNTHLRPGLKPVVSVVILNYNKPALTALAVMAVLSAGLTVPYEVVVVDNGSEAAHVAALEAACFGFRLRSLGANKLFGEGNNLGAADAQGAYLLFLNNDAFLARGAVEEMLAAFARDGACGAAGPVFFYPDGRVQEAGAFVDVHGNAHQRGKGEPGFDVDRLPRFETVDYVSAACLMVRREMFLALEGFSPRYAPAYYEDTDFCFRLLRAGKIVRLARDAHCIHVEGATTAGQQTPDEAQALSSRQRSKFVADWGAYLRGRGRGDLGGGRQPGWVG